MKTKVTHIISHLHPRRVSSVLEVFLKDESISGKLILVATILSLIVVNSPLQYSYDRFWHLPLSLGLGGLSLSLDLRHWVSEGLMAFFFLIVGLEIKRELVKGELREFRTAILPIGAAVGGMIVPAVIYLLFNLGTETVKGWGIPIATDIAFAIAILTLLGKRVPVALKIFLLTLAIADDIGAIIVIGLFYAEIIHFGYLAAAIMLIISMYVLRKYLLNKLAIVIGAGIFLWIFTHLSGIHASIVGAALGLLAPVSIADHGQSVTEKIEKLFLPLTTFVVLPVFAFANAGFILSANALEGNRPVLWGILLGLIAGKALGITGVTWLLVKTKAANLPEGVTMRHILGVSLIAGIGFTVSIFITELAFAGNEQLVSTAKVGIFIASILSAILGSLVLLKRKHPSSE